MSMKPGETTQPAASIRSAASAADRSPTAAILPPSIATSPRKDGPPVPSTTVPFKISVSKAMSFSLNQWAGRRNHTTTPAASMSFQARGRGSSGLLTAMAPASMSRCNQPLPIQRNDDVTVELSVEALIRRLAHGLPHVQPRSLVHCVGDASPAVLPLPVLEQYLHRILVYPFVAGNAPPRASSL